MTGPSLEDVRTLLDEESQRARRDMPSLDTFIRAANSRRQRRRGVALGATLVAVLAVGGLGMALRSDHPALEWATRSSSFQAAEPDATEPPVSARPDHVAQRIAEQLHPLGRDGGGTWISEDQLLNIYVAGPDSGKAAVVEETTRLADELTRESAITVQVHAGGVRTEDQLVAIMDAVSDTNGYAPAGSVVIRGQRIDYTTGQVDVEVTTQDAAALVQQEFGDGVRTRVKTPWTQDELDDMFGIDEVPTPTSTPPGD